MTTIDTLNPPPSQTPHLRSQMIKRLVDRLEANAAMHQQTARLALISAYPPQPPGCHECLPRFALDYIPHQDCSISPMRSECKPALRARGSTEGHGSGFELYVDVLCRSYRFDDHRRIQISTTTLGRVWVWCDNAKAFPRDIGIRLDTTTSIISRCREDECWRRRFDEVWQACDRRLSMVQSVRRDTTRPTAITRQAVICIPDSTWRSAPSNETELASCIVGLGITFLTTYRQNLPFFCLRRYDHQAYETQEHALSASTSAGRVG